VVFAHACSKVTISLSRKSGRSDKLRHHKQLFSSTITFGYNPKRPISLVVEYEPEAERAQPSPGWLTFQSVESPNSRPPPELRLREADRCP
jgi:hypothetical protein